MTKASISKRALVVRTIATIVVVVLTTTVSILWTFYRVQNDIVKSNVDNMFAAVESGPLEFAHLHSATVADRQLALLMKSVVNLQLGYRSVKIVGGEQFSDKFAEWRSQDSESSPVKACIYTAHKTYNRSSFLFPFLVEISVDVCEGFPLIKSLQYSILGILTVSFLVISLSPLSILVPLGASISAMEGLIANRIAPEKLDSVRYEPLRNVVKLAIHVRQSEREAAVGRMIAQLSHDFRAPLGTFEKLLYADPQVTIASQRETIRDSLFRLNTMIESLRHTDRESLIQTAVEIVSFHEGIAGLAFKANAKRIRLSYPSDTIYSRIDKVKFERAWCNLVSNAIDSAKSSVVVELEVEDKNLVLRVTDDGPGVPDEFLPKLFQRGATHGKHDGTGLGLAYVRQIMRGHGGDVTYRRENGLTIFECYLPNAVVTNQEDTVQSQAAPAVEKAVKVKQVGICFVPKSMADSLCAELASHDSVKFSFTTEYKGADIVATNDPDLALTAIEEGKQPLEFRARLSEAVVLDMLKRRFELV